MDYFEIETNAKKLPPDERLRLAESLLHSLHPKKRSLRKKSSLQNPAKPQKIEFSRGMLRRAGLPPMTDEDVESAINAYLTEKYLKP